MQLKRRFVLSASPQRHAVSVVRVVFFLSHASRSRPSRRPRNHYGPNRVVLARAGRVRAGRRGRGRQEGLAGGRGLCARGVARPAGRGVPVERRARGAGHRGGDGQTVGTGAEREGLRGRVLV